MLSVRCASQFVGDLGQMMPYSGLCNLNLAQISRKCGDAVYRDRWRECLFKHALARDGSVFTFILDTYRGLYSCMEKDSYTHCLAWARPASSPALIIWDMIFPMAVASVGPAYTVFPVALAVSWFR